ncbi:hypothetical protein L1987_59311 [Smallanthus sonchifolius]|uniref:Uncharacterized protein n=1 Tax=Smallanthus sonchifolius TaxID=185202 RepID=A0ACB9D4W7_9ASTR|nr:hypothetical protein L1987_59311 [Smallanthus sonchifolius]
MEFIQLCFTQMFFIIIILETCCFDVVDVILCILIRCILGHKVMCTAQLASHNIFDGVPNNFVGGLMVLVG